jgi:tetratricopeptide (TPR) repeat protein
VIRTRLAAVLALPLITSAAHAQSPPPSSGPPSAATSNAPQSATTPNAASAQASSDQVFASALRAYHAALLQRRLGQTDLRREDVALRVAEGEELLGAGRVDEAIARLAEMVEHPQFDLFSDSEEGRAAVFRLGDALATAGIFEPARIYLRRVIEAKGAWDDVGPAHVWPRRAVRRLVEVALQTEKFAAIVGDLASVPPSAPADIREEIAYIDGRAQEASGHPEAALAAYGSVTQHCPFWSQATYLSALIHVEAGRYKEGEGLLCKLADPTRSASTTPVLADEKFFAIRDLARLGLGRIAHEQGRNDDARYYYYLVPQDSDRLAEALYEAATTRYEKKDYDGARELLDELAALGVHNRYEDEANVLDAWVDLARCRFPDADRKLVDFLKRYEPVRDGARHIADGEVATEALLATVHTGTDPAGAEVGGTSPDVVRAIASLVRLDPAYDHVVQRRAVLEREASGLAASMGVLIDMQRSLATNGGVRPTTDLGSDAARSEKDVREGVASLEHQISDLEASRTQDSRVAPLREALTALKAEAAQTGAASADSATSQLAAGADLGDLLRADTTRVSQLQARIAVARRELSDAESALAKDALHRLDLRLSRLLRRARLGRIESVLGRKRALEVEVEAIRLGFLPQDAVDSLDAARYLEDSEEYWPFEGDDWPDEYVGGEVK